MAIAILNELQQRLHTAAIAGVGVIAEDFRLKKTIAQLETMTAQSPVFAKIYQTAAPLTDMAVLEKERVLLDAITLVDAVVCTQGDYKVEGVVQPLALYGAGTLKQCRYRELAPLREALTTTGSGRFEVVQSAFQRRDPVLSDFRLRGALVTALADSYGDMATLAASILEYLGPEIIPTLKQDFDPQGKKHMARRVLLIRKLAGSKENEFYRSLLESGNLEVKQEAIGALALDNENVELLLSLAKTEKGSLKKAALHALSEMDTPQSNDYWLTQIEKGQEAVLPYVNCLTDSEIADAVAALLENFCRTPCTAATQEEIGAYMHSLAVVAQTVANKTSEKLFAVLVNLAKNPPALPAPVSCRARNYAQTINYECSLTVFLSEQIATGLVYRPTEAGKDMAARLYAQHPDYAPAAFTAALLTDSSRAYDGFARCFEHAKEAEPLFRVLNRLYYQKKLPENESGGYILLNEIETEPQQWKTTRQLVWQTLDIRWVKLLMQEKTGLLKNLLNKGQEQRENNDHLLIKLINKKDAAATELLRNYFCKRAKLALNETALEGYKKCGGQDFSGLLLKLIEKQNSGFWVMQMLYRTYPMPLDTALAELRQLEAAAKDKHTKTRLEAWILRLQTGEEVLNTPELDEGEE